MSREDSLKEKINHIEDLGTLKFSFQCQVITATFLLNSHILVS